MKKCNHESTERYNNYYDGIGLVEYSIRCTDCKKRVGTWAYGYWLDGDDDDDETED